MILMDPEDATDLNRHRPRHVRARRREALMSKRARWKKRPQPAGEPIIFDRIGYLGTALATVSSSPGGWIGTIGEDSFGPYGDPEIAKQSAVKRLKRSAG